MIYDRPYMRQDSGRQPWSVVVWIMVITGVAFVLQQIMGFHAPLRDTVLELGALSVQAVRHGYIWTVLTYGLLHEGMLHIILNMLGLYFIGRMLLPMVGPTRFVGLYVGATLVGGLVWVGLHAAIGTDAHVIGASGAIYGLMSAVAFMMPDVPVTLIPIPITVKPKQIALVLLGIAVFGLILFEIPNKPGSEMAYSAHLGGMLAGWFYARHVHHRTGEFSGRRPSIELPAWMRKRRRAAAPKTNYRVNVSPPVDLRAEVDRILDKINSQGFGSLTEDERRMLDEARDLLNKR